VLVCGANIFVFVLLLASITVGNLVIFCMKTPFGGPFYVMKPSSGNNVTIAIVGSVSVNGGKFGFASDTDASG